MADYPSSVVNLATNLDGDVIFAAIVNAIQDEVEAIETALLNGFQHALIPLTDATYDLGSSSFRWQDGHFSGDLRIKGVAYTWPSADGTAGQTLQTNGSTVLSWGSAATVPTGIVNGRLTVETGVPVSASDQTAKTTLYFTAYGGNYIALYDGSSAWSLVSFTEISIAIPATTSQMYDVFVYNNAGTATLELTAWTNDTTRSTALTTQNGVLVRTGATTRRFVGCVRTTGSAGQTEDSVAKRYVWNYYNRVRKYLRVTEATNSYTYNTATLRQVNGAATNQIDVIVGVAEVIVDLTAIHFASNDTSDQIAIIAIGEDSTSAAATGCIGMAFTTGPSATTIGMGVVKLQKMPAIGRHYYAWLEQGSNSNTTTWYGDNNTPTLRQAGLTGWVEG